MTIGKGTKQGEDLKARAVRIGGLEDQVRDLKGQIKEINAQIADELKDAESVGLNKRVLRKVIGEMALAQDERQSVFDFESEVDTYRHALGILSGAEMIVEEMTEVERRRAMVFGAGSDEGKEAIGKAKARAEDKLRKAKRDSQAPLEVVR